MFIYTVKTTINIMQISILHLSLYVVTTLYLKVTNCTKTMSSRHTIQCVFYLTYYIQQVNYHSSIYSVYLSVLECFHTLYISSIRVVQLVFHNRHLCNIVAKKFNYFVLIDLGQLTCLSSWSGFPGKPFVLLMPSLPVSTYS